MGECQQGLPDLCSSSYTSSDVQNEFSFVDEIGIVQNELLSIYKSHWMLIIFVASICFLTMIVLCFAYIQRRGSRASKGQLYKFIEKELDESDVTDTEMDINDDDGKQVLVEDAVIL